MRLFRMPTLLRLLLSISLLPIVETDQKTTSDKQTECYRRCAAEVVGTMGAVQCMDASGNKVNAANCICPDPTFNKYFENCIRGDTFTACKSVESPQEEVALSYCTSALNPIVASTTTSTLPPSVGAPPPFTTPSYPTPTDNSDLTSAPDSTLASCQDRATRFAIALGIVCTFAGLLSIFALFQYIDSRRKAAAGREPEQGRVVVPPGSPFAQLQALTPVELRNLARRANRLDGHRWEEVLVSQNKA
ncbi:hypothetical protein ABW19_dt0207479 [Dactylella cylindrospora]|nr:hypothetical protein ABW19_dt0207479 [Dactylella cylindrospora]